MARRSQFAYLPCVEKAERAFCACGNTIVRLKVIGLISVAFAVARADSKKERMIEMIVKYRKNDVWGYIDNVRQVAVKDLNCQELMNDYDTCECYKDVTHAGDKDMASYLDGEKLPVDIANVNKVFLMATENQEDWGDNVHTENLLNTELMKDGIYAAVVLLYLEEHKNCDSMALVTNQKCFLMNDKGQTVERLV